MANSCEKQSMTVIELMLVQGNTNRNRENSSMIVSLYILQVADGIVPLNSIFSLSNN